VDEALEMVDEGIDLFRRVNKTVSWRTAEDRRGSARADPADERGKSAVGCGLIIIMSFQEELLQLALFGADRIFTPAKATTADIEEHALVLTHDDGAGTVRPDGQGKRTPRRSSSCRIEWRSADGVTPRCAAAARKLKRSATATNAVRSARSRRPIPEFLSILNAMDMAFSLTPIVHTSEVFESKDEPSNVQSHDFHSVVLAGGLSLGVTSRDAQWLHLQQRQCRLRSIGSCEQVRIGISRSPGKEARHDRAGAIEITTADALEI
jgi:hypothetical protein